MTREWFEALSPREQVKIGGQILKKRRQYLFKNITQERQSQLKEYLYYYLKYDTVADFSYALEGINIPAYRDIKGYAPKTALEREFFNLIYSSAELANEDIRKEKEQEKSMLLEQGEGKKFQSIRKCLVIYKEVACDLGDLDCGEIMNDKSFIDVITRRLRKRNAPVYKARVKNRGTNYYTIHEIAREFIKSRELGTEDIGYLIEAFGRGALGYNDVEKYVI